MDTTKRKIGYLQNPKNFVKLMKQGDLSEVYQTPVASGIEYYLDQIFDNIPDAKVCMTGSFPLSFLTHGIQPNDVDIVVDLTMSEILEIFNPYAGNDNIQIVSLPNIISNDVIEFGSAYLSTTDMPSTKAFMTVDRDVEKYFIYVHEECEKALECSCNQLDEYTATNMQTLASNRKPKEPNHADSPHPRYRPLRRPGGSRRHRCGRQHAADGRRRR